MLERYRAKRELKKRTQGFTPEARTEYLNKILSKEKLLKEPTRDAAYSLLGDIYNKMRKEQCRHTQGEINDYLINAVKAYIKARQLGKASFINTNAYPISRRNNKPRSIPEYYGPGNEERQELQNLINKARRHKGRRKNLATKLSAFIFFIGGLILMIASNFSPTLTGNVVGSSIETNTSFFIALALMIIGGVLLFKSFKKK